METTARENRPHRQSNSRVVMPLTLSKSAAARYLGVARCKMPEIAATYGLRTVVLPGMKQARYVTKELEALVYERV